MPQLDFCPTQAASNWQRTVTTAAASGVINVIKRFLGKKEFSWVLHEFESGYSICVGSRASQ